MREYNFVRAGIGGAVGKISAFRPQGPQFDPRLYQDLNIFVTSFPPTEAKVSSYQMLVAFTYPERMELALAKKKGSTNIKISGEPGSLRLEDRDLINCVNQARSLTILHNLSLNSTMDQAKEIFR